jgi:hypothetical protein
MRILEIYKDKKINMDFKNVQRRVYDALNVLSALGIIKKDRNRVKFRGGPFKRGVAGNLIRNPQSSENRENILIKKQKQERLK